MASVTLETHMGPNGTLFRATYHPDGLFVPVHGPWCTSTKDAINALLLKAGKPLSYGGARHAFELARDAPFCIRDRLMAAGLVWEKQT